MYITSCLPSSFPFNKTYAVAVTKEAATKKEKGWVQDCLQLYHRVLWLLSWAAEGRGSLPTSAVPRKGQGLQTTRRGLWPVSHTRLLQHWAWSPWRKVKAKHRSLETQPPYSLVCTGFGDIHSPCRSLVDWVAPFQPGGSPYHALRVNDLLKVTSYLLSGLMPKNLVCLIASSLSSPWGQVLRDMHFLLKILPLGLVFTFLSSMKWPWSWMVRPQPFFFILCKCPWPCLGLR